MNNEFTKWFFMCVRYKYADFSGRARRKEYWMYTLVYCILLCIVTFIATFLQDMEELIANSLLFIFSLALLIPSIAVAVRRLHDVGRSAWWLLITFVPILGTLYFLYLLVKDSQPDTNMWGANPKTIT